MDEPLPLTVIICTWQRPEAVRKLLLNLEEQRPRPAEVLVVEGHDTRRGDCSDPDCILCSLTLPFRCRHFLSHPSLEDQRNVGTDLVDAPVVCFLDDDVLLEPGCLAHIWSVFDRDTEGKIGGVGGFDTVARLAGQVPWRWRVRRALGVVSSLTPGRYHRSGQCIPLEMTPPFSGVRRVDFLSGYCMAYRRHVLQEFRFVPDIGNGEDLHYSLRVARRYELYHCGDARLQHLVNPVGRASRKRYGFMTVYNRFRYQRDCLPDRRLRDVCLLWYGVAIDLGMLAALWAVRGDRRPVGEDILGRLRAIYTLATQGADAVAIEAARRAFPRRSTKEY